MVFVWKFGSLEAWRLGGATEVKARPAAPGGDETGRGAGAPRRTENGEQSARKRATDRPLYRGFVHRAFTRAPASPASPVSPAGASFWHVVDVPGVQGELLPAGAWGSRGCRENFSLPGRGAAPHIPISQSPNQPIPFCVLCVLCDFQSILAVLHPSPFVPLRGSSCPFVSAPQGKPSTPSQRPRLLRFFVSSWKVRSDFACITNCIMLSSSPAMETQPGFRHPFVYEKARTITCLTSRAPPSV